MSPATLQRLLTETIDAVIDRKAFNAEVDAEKNDAAHIAVQRQRFLKLLRGEIE